MTTTTRVRIARLVFLLEESDARSRDAVCACRRPLSPMLTAVIRGAIDDVVSAMANEPETSRMELVEVD